MIYLDFETRGLVDLTKVGVTRYATDRHTQVLCMAWTYDDEERIRLWHRHHPWTPKSPRPSKLLERIASGEPVEAHNAGFEFGIWNTTLRREFSEFDVPLVLEQMWCSAAKGSCMSMPRALGDAAAAAGISEQKLADGRRLINKLSKPQKRRAKKSDADWDIDDAIEPLWYWNEEPEEHKKNWAYCQQDIRTERCFSHWLSEMTAREREYWLMDQRMNARGITLDMYAAQKAEKLALDATQALNWELANLTRDAVQRGSNRQKFKTWVNQELTELGAEPLVDTTADTMSFALYGAPTKASDEIAELARPIADERWSKYGKRGKVVRRAMAIAMEVNKTSVAKFTAMNKSVAPDGRIHDIMLYNGADRTGRWAGKGVQPHNFVRGYKEEMNEVWDDILNLDPRITTIIWDEPLIMLAKSCRGALTASAGRELYAADFNAIEARKLAWMSNCASQMKLFNTKGGDPYIDMAQAIYKRELNKKDNPGERNLGKRAVLGLGYAMGWEKFQATVWKEEGIWLDDEFCQMIVEVYRKEKCPEVPILWKDTEAAAIAAVVEGGEHWAGGNDEGIGAVKYFVKGRFLHCQLPSGRLLAYLDPRVRTRVTWRFRALNEHGKKCFVTVPSQTNVSTQRARKEAERLAIKARKTLTNDPPKNYAAPHLSFMGRDKITMQWKRLGTHGGTLVENNDQASSRDLLAESMYRVDQDERFDLLLSIHDEVIAEGDTGICGLEEFEDLMAIVPVWAPGMPIKAEGWIAPRLRK